MTKKEPAKYWASVYCREVNDPKCRLLDGPMDLASARVMVDRLVAEALADRYWEHPGSPMYYEIRGVDGCPVRLRFTIERPAAFARVDVLESRVERDREQFEWARTFAWLESEEGKAWLETPDGEKWRRSEWGERFPIDGTVES